MYDSLQVPTLPASKNTVSSYTYEHAEANSPNSFDTVET